jgi:hypothetical protein
MASRRKTFVHEPGASPVLRAPERRVQAAPNPKGRLDEYLTRRETAQTVPPGQALSAHPEVPDTLQTKRDGGDAGALDARLQRARRLGHHWTGEGRAKGTGETGDD